MQPGSQRVAHEPTSVTSPCSAPARLRDFCPGNLPSAQTQRGGWDRGGEQGRKERKEEGWKKKGGGEEGREKGREKGRAKKGCDEVEVVV